MECTGNNSIRPLPSSTSNLIKSQVDLNTFSSCILEVVKNSVDAHASRISITVDFKRLYFVVVDNGEGITPNDLELTGISGHTSKFHLDNENRTYGYRGESLNSISSQATVIILSRSQAYNVTKSIRISYGERFKSYLSADAMSSAGTSVTCQGLFSNFPVRQKQALTVSDMTLIEQLKKGLFPIAVAFPGITFSMHGPNNSRTLFIPGLRPDSTVPRHVELLRVIHSFASIMTWDCVRAKSKNTTVAATISHNPSSFRTSQYIVINGFLLSENTLYNSINKIFMKSGFGCSNGSKAVGGFPAFVIDIRYPVSAKNYILDPQRCIYSKEDFDYIANLIFTICRKFLTSNDYRFVEEPEKSLMSQIDERQLTSPQAVSGDAFVYSNARIAFHDSEELRGRLTLSQSVGLAKPSNKRLSIRQNDTSCNSCNLHQVDTPSALGPLGSAFSRFFKQPVSNIVTDCKISKNSLETCRVISQVGNKFIFVVCRSDSNDHLVIIDQHAADERIKLEHFLNQITLKDLRETAVQLEETMILEINNDEKSILTEFVLLFNQFGIFYTVMEGAKSKVVVTKIPELAYTRISTEKDYKARLEFIKKLVIGHVHSISGRQVSRITQPKDMSWEIAIKNYPLALISIYKSRACKEAIKFGDKLDLAQCQKLVKDLSRCIYPFQCAHGRPSMIPLVDLSFS